MLLLSHVSERIADTPAPVRSRCILEHRALEPHPYKPRFDLAVRTRSMQKHVQSQSLSRMSSHHPIPVYTVVHN